VGEAATSFAGAAGLSLAAVERAAGFLPDAFGASVFDAVLFEAVLFDAAVLSAEESPPEPLCAFVRGVVGFFSSVVSVSFLALGTISGVLLYDPTPSMGGGHHA
jgi:hypothetical protein